MKRQTETETDRDRVRDMGVRKPADHATKDLFCFAFAVHVCSVDFGEPMG